MSVWPVTSWSVLDSADTPKLSWHAVRRAYDPLLLSAFEDKGPLRFDRSGQLPLRARDEDGECQAWLSHEWDFEVQGTLSVELASPKGRLGLIHSGRIRLAAGSSSKLWSARRKALGITDPSRQYLVFRFSAPGLERRAILHFERPRRLSLEEPGLRQVVSHQGELCFIRIHARKLALAVELLANVPGQFSDNGFDLLPGERRDIVFSPSKPGAKARFEVKTLNAIALKQES